MAGHGKRLRLKKIAKRIRCAVTFDRVVSVLSVLVPLAVALIERRREDYE